VNVKFLAYLPEVYSEASCTLLLRPEKKVGFQDKLKIIIRTIPQLSSYMISLILFIKPASKLLILTLAKGTYYS
jgi:hypothetical protein